jgi:hypothetical protein
MSKTETDEPKSFMNGESSISLAAIYTGHAIKYADLLDPEFVKPESVTYRSTKNRFVGFVRDAISYTELAISAVQQHRGYGWIPAPELIQQAQQFRQAVDELHGKTPGDDDVRTLSGLVDRLKLDAPKPG